ncbi:CBS domain-containing protein [Heliorestis acidaminivorans]|uniref:CBS domain-containing protein n=1 Tax=Heliorestis acidaminivorans TaxID=553427 RepID=A0A6I0F4Y7_9FIRM|nr:CBS and ACT domain-containing protein [Heliorestis acidaminivorans]KAB2953892.1 CBS domain-containing protein [Heliorestis acidaminivorans]
MLVRNWMNKRPITIQSDSTLADAMALMHNHKIRRLPVMEKDELVGIVTKSDILRTTPPGSMSTYEMHLLSSSTFLYQIMSTDVITVDADALLEEAALILRKNKIGGMPVLSNNKIVGMISGTDILDTFLHVMGISKKGLRLNVTINNQPGELAKLTEIVKKYGNISSIVNFAGKNGKASLVLRLEGSTENKDELQEILLQEGFQVQTLIEA